MTTTPEQIEALADQLGDADPRIDDVVALMRQARQVLLEVFEDRERLAQDMAAQPKLGCGTPAVHGTTAWAPGAFDGVARPYRVRVNLTFELMDDRGVAQGNTADRNPTAMRVVATRHEAMKRGQFCRERATTTHGGIRP